MNTTMNRAQWGLLIFLSILWGGSFYFNEIVVRSLPPLTIVFARTALASLVLLAILRWRGHALPTSWRVWGALAVMGLINNLLPFTLIVWGQQTIGSGMASILNATSPLFSVLLAHFWTRDERLTFGRIGGILLGLAGVIVLIGPATLLSGGNQVWAQLAVLAAALCYAVSAVWGRRFRTLPPLVPAGGMLLCTAVMMLPLTLIVDQPWQLTPRLDSLLALLALALLSTCLAYLIYFRLLASAGATNLLLVTFLIPITAVLLGVALLDEALTPQVWAGMGLVFAGLLAVDGRIWQKLTTRQPPTKENTHAT